MSSTRRRSRRAVVKRLFVLYKDQLDNADKYRETTKLGLIYTQENNLVSVFELTTEYLDNFITNSLLQGDSGTSGLSNLRVMYNSIHYTNVLFPDKVGDELYNIRKFPDIDSLRAILDSKDDKYYAQVFITVLIEAERRQNRSAIQGMSNIRAVDTEENTADKLNQFLKIIGQ